MQQQYIRLIKPCAINGCGYWWLSIQPKGMGMMHCYQFSTRPTARQIRKAKRVAYFTDTLIVIARESFGIRIGAA